MIDFFQEYDAEWELCVQLCTDLSKMPIEDASVVWPEVLSPYRPVARLFIPKQTGWSDERAHELEDGMFFSPWHGLAAHRPLGSIMRARKPAYEASFKFRSMLHHASLKEPENVKTLSG